MILSATIEEIRRAVGEARAAGKSVGLVPTMGALHEGHLSLIRAAGRSCGFVVVSIFVNPTQFVAGEDYDSYPRDLPADLTACESNGVDAVFAPSAEEMYPRRPLTRIHVEELSETLCGRYRPGHFDGVCTVCAKLFNIIPADKAFFGAKDFQQSVIVRRLVADLNLPVEIVVCPTVRESDGLAISSRNAYLTPDERRQAPALHAALQQARELIAARRPPADEAIRQVRRTIAAQAPDASVEYVQVVEPDTLEDVERTDRPVVVALAARLGKARLIDNIRVD